MLTFPDSNVIVIKHWKIHNTIPKDRYKPTVYVEEKNMLYTKENGAYTFDVSKSVTKRRQNVTTDKIRKDKNSIYTKNRKKDKFHNFDEREYTEDEMEELEQKLLEANR